MSGERGARETLRRRDRPGRERRVPVKGIRQLPFARIENRYPPIQLLSADELESIHRASLRLLQEVGMEVLHDESRAQACFTIEYSMFVLREPRLPRRENGSRLVEQLRQRGIAVAMRDGNLRLSVHVYNHEDDIARLVRALTEL